MAGEDIQNLLRSGIEAARSGNKEVARRILEQVITLDSRNELAWMWLASVMDTGEERQRALRRVLSINPANERAQQALRKLQTGTLRPVQGDEIPRPAPPPPPPPSAPGARPLPQRSEPPRRRERRSWSIQRQLAIIAAFFMILAAAALTSRELTKKDDNTPARQVAFQLPTPTVTLTPTITFTPRPTNTISPDTIIVTELPGVWTPSPVVSSTPSPEPTARPDTRSSLEIVFSGANQASAPAQLLTVRADGDLLPRRLPIDMSGISEDLYEELEFFDPAYSPDGRMLAFTTQIAPDVQEIFVLALENGALRQLTNLGASITDGATWSADGQRLAFSSNAPSTNRATIFDIYEIDVDSGESRPLTDGTARSREPVWSPDGRLLVFSSDKGSPGEREIWSIAMTTGSRTPEKLTDAANSSFAPSFSPDSAQIVFISNRGGDNDLFVMNADGSSERLLSADDGGIDERDPAWSPDGNWILLSSDRSGGPALQLWLVRPNGSDWTPVTDGDGDNRAGNWLPIN